MGGQGVLRQTLAGAGGGEQREGLEACEFLRRVQQGRTVWAPVQVLVFFLHLMQAVRVL